MPTQQPRRRQPERFAKLIPVLLGALVVLMFVLVFIALAVVLGFWPG
ncbi:MAG: hypothetical protein HUU23_13290 [Caldilineales bacterium]|nr:hypothetical protein [Caldilineales bacterium]